jgi:hypothetical protein
MLAVVAAMLLGQVLVPRAPEGPIFQSGTRGPAFAFAPPNGQGMPAECSGGTIRGSKGEAITFARASAATCIKADGTVVKLTSGQPACGPYPGGTEIGCWSERAATNRLLRSEEFENAAWTNSATVTADQYTAPDGTATADRIDDDQAGSTEGSCQSVATTDLRQYSFTVFLRSDTASSARMTITGAGNSAGDRSCSLASFATGTNCHAYSNGWSRCECTSANAFGAGLTDVAVCVNVGTADATTGRLQAWGAQLSAEAAWATTIQHGTTYVPTTTAAATRAATAYSLPWPAPTVTDAVGCVGVSVYFPRFSGTTVLTGTWVMLNTAVTTFDDNSATTTRFRDGTNTRTSSALTNLLNRKVRALGGWRTSDLSLSNYSDNSTLLTGTFDGTIVSATLRMSNDNSSSNQIEGWFGNVVLDKSRDGCR